MIGVTSVPCWKQRNRSQPKPNQHRSKPRPIQHIMLAFFRLVSHFIPCFCIPFQPPHPIPQLKPTPPNQQPNQPKLAQVPTKKNTHTHTHKPHFRVDRPQKNTPKEAEEEEEEEQPPNVATTWPRRTWAAPTRKTAPRPTSRLQARRLQGAGLAEETWSQPHPSRPFGAGHFLSFFFGGVPLFFSFEGLRGWGGES